MPSFTTRVELHGASDDDYDILHEAMEAEGFSRTITDGKDTYQLPTAEYSFVGNRTKQEVLQMANRAATTTGKTHSILVTQSAGRTWMGLTKV